MFYRIIRSKDNGNTWQDTPHIREADSVNEALRLFGMTDAIADPSVTTAIGHKTGRMYTAVDISNPAETVTVTPKESNPKVRTVKSHNKPEQVSNSNTANKDSAIVVALQLVKDNPNTYTAKDISDMFAEKGEQFDARWLSPVTKLVKRNKANRLKLADNGKARLANGISAQAKSVKNSATVDAPYGLKKDGTPAKRRGRKPGNKVTQVEQIDARTQAALDILKELAPEYLAN